MKKFIVTITFLSYFMGSYAQLDKLKGAWVTPQQEFISIVDTNNIKVENYLSNADLRDEHFRLFLYKDTLSFQRHYTSSRTQFKVQHIDRYDLRVLRITDSMLEVEPVSSFSKEFFKGKDKLTLVRQELTIDRDLQFEKIVVHTSRCYGTCGVYHMEINNTGSFKLLASFIHNDYNWQGDTAKQGYYTGKLPVATYDSLINALQTCSLRTLRMRTVECCDGGILTMIIYFNGQRKYFKTMIRPQIATELVRSVYSITRNAVNYGTKTNEKFEIEDLAQAKE